MEQNNSYQEDKIDLLELIQIAVNGKKTIIRFVVLFGLLGLFIALFSPKEYTASTVVVPQTSEGKGGIGNLGGIAAMAGINIGGGGGSESIPPSLYPKIVQSIPFKKELLKTPIYISSIGKEVTYQEYYRNHTKSNVLDVIAGYTIGLPRKILNLFKKESKQVAVNTEKNNEDKIYRITSEEKGLFGQLGSQLVVENNVKEGVVFLSFSMPEALPSAQMAKKAQELLQKAITDFKIQKAQEEFQFINKRYKEIKEEFIKKQSTLANFIDRNQGLITHRSQTRLKRLEAEYSLLSNIYTEVAKKLEMQKVKLKEDTPVFTVIEPVSVPLDRSKPRRGFILAIWLFVGFVFGVAFVFVKNWLENLKKNN